MNYLAIILARCGSKGMPSKLLQEMTGKPLLTWSIEHALSCPAITRTVVATDCEDVASTARTAGAQVPMLIPSALVKENALPEPALLHILDELAKHENFRPDAVILLNPITPLRLPGRITAAIWQFEAENADSLLSVCPTHSFLWKNPKEPQANYDYYHKPKPQEIPEAERMYRENGSITITKTDLLQTNKNLLGGKISLFMMDEKESQESDSPALTKATQEWSNEKNAQDQTQTPKKAPLEWLDALVFDFDGVLTDNRVLVQEDGTESVYCNRSDGMGFDILRAAGIPAFIMSSETNRVVTARARKLKLPVYQAVQEKGAALKQLCQEHHFAPERILFVGNDINDLPAMKVAGYPVAVADAMPSVRKAAWRVLKTNGGAGIVRELIDHILGMSQN